MSGGWDVFLEPIAELIAATRGDVAHPLKEIAQRAASAELGDQNAFSELLSGQVPEAVERFDTAAEGALRAAADFADALAEAVGASSRAYEDADRRGAEELLRLTGELRSS
ncbi:hypothetical protein [Glycomyces harbinensis]|uniref:Excreted virulence factor EspC, type VII ESX diderm n=1 Tax=Glycomyces harbinensis TaxID=58114 RepID=A0A1G6VMP1_9ACTN|nr:hypothetical protein [Glycomyces harbinensis]SDD54818.1 hypothetical protein SAMN05216270_10531 [Glycomyces harbinensis]